MKRIIGWLLFVLGCWMLISPQAILGLEQLRWMYEYSFPGEIMIGIFVISFSFYLIDVKPREDNK